MATNTQNEFSMLQDRKTLFAQLLRVVRRSKEKTERKDEADSAASRLDSYGRS
jgi:hypothetical protein